MTMKVELGDARFLKPGRLRWLRALGWMVLLGAAVLLGFGLSSGILLGGSAFIARQTIQAVDPTILLASMIVGSLVTLAIYVALVRWAERRRASELAPRAIAFELPVGLLIGFAMMALVVAIASLAGWMNVSRAPVTGIQHALSDTIESGVLEETLFRLVIFRLFWRAFGVWPALGLSALIFGLVHLSNPNANLFAALCIAVEAGIMLATFYITTGRAWMSIGVHAGWNFTQGWIFGAAVSGTGEFGGGPLLTFPTKGVPDWLSGGNFGPEASLAGLIVGGGVGGYMLWRCVKRGRMTPRTD